MSLSKHYTFILIILSLVFFFLYSGFYILNHDIFNSPDETANHFFMHRIATSESLATPHIILSDDARFVVPRSVRVVDNSLVPASFLGLILVYGSVGFLFGLWSLYFVGGLVAVLGVWGVFQLFSFVWGRDRAFYATLLLFFLPAWWYYAAFAYYPNVLLVTSFVWGVNFLLYYGDRKKILFLILSVIFIGVAILTRLAALPWIACVLLTLAFLYFKRERLFMPQFLYAFLIAIPIFILLRLQSYLYGSSFATGYIISASQHESFFLRLKGYFFPYGFDLVTTLSNLYHYYGELFWYITIPGILGVVYFIFTYAEHSQKEKIYFYLYGAVSGWLVLYYAPWVITDSVDGSISYGVSYVRYWLPIYVGGLPFVIFTFQYLFKKFNVGRTLTLVCSTGLFVLFICISVQSLFFTNTDSLTRIQGTLDEYRIKKLLILNMTEENSIILTYRQDKIFFPERMVIDTINNDDVFEALPRLLEHHPIYSYTFLPEDDYSRLVGNKLTEYGLSGELIFGKKDKRLYRIYYEE